jgi:hypothetical protein
MADHEYYTGLSASAACALAISRQLSEQEGSEWIEHVGSCAECRQLMHDFMRVSFRLLPEGDGVDGTSRVTAQASVERARSNVQVAEPSAKHSMRWPSVAALILSAVLCVAAFTVYRRSQNHAPYIQNSTPSHISVSRGPTTDSQGTNNKLLGEIAEMKEKFRKAQIHIGDLEANAKIDQQAIRASVVEKEDMLSRIAANQKIVADLRSVAEDRDGKIRQLQDQLTSNEAALQANESDLRTVAAKLLETERHLRQERERNVILGQLQALLGARNLHFADVHDDNATGSGRFGRVLYAKGQVLMFYAYRLAEGTQLTANISYHLWGKKGEAAKTIKRLGVLQRDDSQEHGWRLTCDDLTVLSQIDSVFVTAETDRKTVTKPSGERMLIANLGDRANHP